MRGRCRRSVAGATGGDHRLWGDTQGAADLAALTAAQQQLTAALADGARSRLKVPRRTSAGEMFPARNGLLGRLAWDLVILKGAVNPAAKPVLPLCCSRAARGFSSLN